MTHPTDLPEAADRRQGERRMAADPAYKGPERRAAERRTGADRRRSPRF